MNRNRIISTTLILASWLFGCGPQDDMDSGKEYWDIANGKADNTLSELSMGALSFSMISEKISKNQIHLYTFSGAKGSSIRIEMSGDSTNFDSYLQLTSPSGTVWEDDDGGGNLSARIKVNALPESGTYTVRATSYKSAGTGTYSLELTCLSQSCIPVNPPPPPTCIGLKSCSIWNEAWLNEPDASSSDLLQLFTPGSSEVPLAGGRIATRYRRCNLQTGCGKWYTVDGIHCWAEDSPFYVKTKPIIDGTLETSGSSGLWLKVQKGFFDVYWHYGAIQSDQSKIWINGVQSPNSYLDLPTSRIDLRPTFKKWFAIALSDTYKSKQNSQGNYLELEYAFFIKLKPNAPEPSITEGFE